MAKTSNFFGFAQIQISMRWSIMTFDPICIYIHPIVFVIKYTAT